MIKKIAILILICGILSGVKSTHGNVASTDSNIVNPQQLSNPSAQSTPDTQREEVARENVMKDVVVVMSAMGRIGKFMYQTIQPYVVDFHNKMMNYNTDNNNLDNQGSYK